MAARRAMPGVAASTVRASARILDKGRRVARRRRFVDSSPTVIAIWSGPPVRRLNLLELRPLEAYRSTVASTLWSVDDSIALMPQELLGASAAYVFVGAYRLLHDARLRDPIWASCRAAFRKGSIVAAVFAVFSLPMTRLYVRWFLKKNVLFSYSEEARLFGIPVQTFATFSLLASQCGMIIEFVMTRQLRKARAAAYEATVQSRGKPPEFWSSYVEEWAVPPVEKAATRLEKKVWYERLSGPLIRMFVLKILLQPLHFVPLLGSLVAAYLRSLSLAETLLHPFFASKHMTPFQQSLYLVENQTAFRSFGMSAALLERVPIVGILFSVSNRVGAAMWAHDLQKRQDKFASGQIPKTMRYERVSVEQDVPAGTVGSFPRAHVGQGMQ